MRLRRYVGLAAGAVVVATMSIPALVTSASAAPSTATASRGFECTSAGQTVPYVVTSQVTADGVAVTATMNDLAATSFPTGLKVAGFKAKVGVKLGSETVQLTGSNTYPTPIAGGGAGVTVQLPMPALTGTRTGTAPLTSAAITGVDLVMVAGFQFGPNPPAMSDNPMTCVPVLSLTRDFSCTAAGQTMPYALTTRVKTTGTAVTATMNDLAATSFPTGLKVAGFKAKVGVKLGSETLELAGNNTYPTPIAGGGTGVTVQLPMPALTGTRTGTTDVRYGKITKIDLVMVAGFQFGPNPPAMSDNVMTCTSDPLPVVQTTTTLSASSPAGGKVALAGSVDPTDEGTVEFYEGATKVGQAAAGAALTISNVAAGEHTYTAKYLPTDATEFAGSTSPAVKVTVAAAPPAGPSATCLKAQGDVKTTAAAVKKADAKVKSTKAAVKKAAKAAKEAKGAKAKKAKAKLKKAKKAAASAAKAAKAAKAKAAAAANAVKANC